MPSLMLAAADMDPMQIAIIVVFVVAGFLKWLWENWQIKRDAAQRDAVPPDPEEQRLREEAWRRQTGQAPQARPPSPASPSAWDELRKAWNELKETARQAPAPAASPPAPARPSRPPPLRQPEPPRRGSVRATLTEAEARLAATRGAAAPPPAQPMQVSAAAESIARPAESVYLTGLHHLRRDPMLMRQAIVLREVLGPPKALQSSSDAAI